jgi:hypothetical protein
MGQELPLVHTDKRRNLREECGAKQTPTPDQWCAQCGARAADAAAPAAPSAPPFNLRINMQEDLRSRSIGSSLPAPPPYALVQSMREASLPPPYERVQPSTTSYESLQPPPPYELMQREVSWAPSAPPLPQQAPAPVRIPKECVMCLTAPRTVRLAPCGHAALCEACFSRLNTSQRRQCPLCRAPIEGHFLGLRSEVTWVEVAGRSPLQGQGGAGWRRTRTLFSSGLLRRPPTLSPPVNRTESEVEMRAALGICEHGNHRSLCRICRLALEAQVSERERERENEAAAATQPQCHCAVS